MTLPIKQPPAPPDVEANSPPPPKPATPRGPVRLALYAIVGVVFGLALALIVFLWTANWNQLRGPIGRYASARAQRHIEIDGDLKVHLLTWTPTLTVQGLKVGNPGWAGPGDVAEVDRLIVSLRLKSLLTGRVVLPLLELDRPAANLLRDQQGRVNWAVGAPDAGTKPFRLPPIQRFVINDGRLKLVDLKRRMTLDGIVTSNESAGGPAAHAFSLVGQGKLNERPFSLQAGGGSLLNLEVDKPYAFTFDLQGVDAQIEATGHLAKPFDFNNFAMDLRLKGRDMADLYYVTDLALPNTPAYDVRGSLTHAGRAYDFKNMSGRIGDSDIAGELKETRSEQNRPTVAADLSSRVLDFKDLAALFGGRPTKSAAEDRPGSTKAGAGTGPGPRKLLPDATLATDRLRGMDATLRYRAAVVKSPYLPLRQAALDLSLQNGVLSIEPVSFSFPQGRISATVRLDARGSTPVTDVDARLSNASLQEFAPRTGNGPPPVEGVVLARAKLHGVGASVHRAAAASSGAVTAVIPGGKIRSAFAELLGVSAGKGLGLLLAKSQQQSDLRCAVANFAVRDGVMQAQTVVFDTDVVKVTGSGSVDLGAETLDLRFKGETKKFRATHVFLPITVAGALASPKLGVQPASALSQAGLAATLGVVLGPLGAIIPFIDPGLAKNADCAALLAESRSSGAPVTAKAAPVHH